MFVERGSTHDDHDDDARVQVEATVSELDEQIAVQTQAVNKKQDKAYAAFSKRMGVASVREYEENVLPAAKKRAHELNDMQSLLDKAKAKVRACAAVAARGVRVRDCASARTLWGTPRRSWNSSGSTT